MEEEHLEKIDNTLKMIDILEEKNSIYKNRIIKNIEFLENELEQASKNLTEIENRNNNQNPNNNFQMENSNKNLKIENQIGNFEIEEEDFQIANNPTIIKKEKDNFKKKKNNSEKKIKIKKSKPNNSESEIQKTIKTLTKNLLTHKPLTNIEQSNKKIYKYISKLGKKIQSLKTFPENSIKINNQTFDHKSLKESIADFILHYSIKNFPGEIYNSKEMCEELGLIQKYKIDKKMEKLKIIKNIETDLENEKIESLFFWVQEHFGELKKLGSRLLFMTFKVYILKQVEKGKDFCLGEVLDEARDLLLGIYEIDSKLIQAFLSSLMITRKNFECFSKNKSFVKQKIVKNKQKKKKTSKEHKKQASNFKQIMLTRYKNQTKINWPQIKSEFLKNIHKIFEISPKDPLFEIFKAGLYTYPKFIKMKNFIKSDFSNNDHIDFSIDLPNEFNYHNLIVCPVTKNICTLDNPPVLLNCGHVISDSSAKKLAKIENENSLNKFKCPVCTAEQFYSEVQQLNIN